MIIPLSHENHRGRRWPYVTIAIIALNALIFLFTHNSMEKEFAQLGEVQSRIVRLAATHPKSPLTQNQQDLVEHFRRGKPAAWDQLSSSQHGPEDKWELGLVNAQPEQVDQEMIALGVQLDRLRQQSTLAHFAFFPSHPTLPSYIGANFLHGGWLHLIFNMWFLWLAGAVLEDVWGRPLYAAVYMVSGMGALGIHALVYPNSLAPVIGASGAIAALMGAFLVRFPKTKIQLGFLYWTFRPRFLRFSWPAYAVLPLWFVGQLFSSAISGEAGGVAYWAHIGGFTMGVILALGLRYSGIEQQMDQAIEAEVSWSAAPRIVKAGEYIEKNETDLAIAELQAQVAENPDSIEAWEMLPALYWKKADVPSHQAALENACRLHAKNKNLEAAWQDYEDYVHAGGSDNKIPCATWLELCRHAEDQQNWIRAGEEYEKLAEAWPAERTTVLALISAARIHLRLGDAFNARRLYAAAQASPVPHRDWDETIRKGLEKTAGARKPETVDISSGPSSS